MGIDAQPGEGAEDLPIAAVRDAIAAQLGSAPLVLSADTGSGKSTQVPRYCPGRVLVVEPRRVACRGLAMRVAQLENCELGAAVGYRVRDDDRSSKDTRVLFATPGIVLRLYEQLERFDHIILDEFHERGMETDLLLALLLRRFPKRLVVMSATLDAERLTRHLGGAHVHAAGRRFPIEIQHMGERAARPNAQDLPIRVARALQLARDAPGDILVFLPGKAEIIEAEGELARRFPDLTVLPLHGGLQLEQQARVFRPTKRRKVVLTTNVAETSITVPGVGIVVDSGLARRTRYHYGRSYLALTAIAADSATQRAGRAGRTGPGLCVRMWGEAAQLERSTPPEIHRESLAQLYLAAGLCGFQPHELPFFDPPKEHAIDDARAELRALEAIDETGHVTEVGSRLFGLPLDPGIGRLLIEARSTGCLDDAIDLAAALANSRPLFSRPVPEDDPLEAGQCDVRKLVHALRGIGQREAGISTGAVQEARRTARRLRGVFGLPNDLKRHTVRERKALAQTAMRADARMVHVVRARGRRIALSNGGTELEVARESLMHRGPVPSAVLVFGTHGVADSELRTRLLATCVMPIEPAWVLEAGLCQDRLAGCIVKRGKLLANVEKVFAKRVFATEQEVPRGAMAREGLATLIAEGRLWPEQREALQVALEQQALAVRLRERMRAAHVDPEGLPPDAKGLSSWLVSRLAELGFDSGEDLPLLSASDLSPPTLPPAVAEYLADNFPVRVDLGDAGYRVEYDLQKRRAILHLVRGQRHQAPGRNYLPRFPGLKIFVEAGGRLNAVR